MRESCQSFPLNRLFDNVNLGINNVNASISQSLCLPPLLRMIDPEYMQQFNGSTPTYLDNYGVLADCVGRSNNPMADYGAGGYNNLLLPRGSHPINEGGFLIKHYTLAGGLVDASPISTLLTDWWVIDVSQTFTEPLFVSPMLFGDPKFNQSSFVGVNNFQLTMNIDQSMKRFWSTGMPFTNVAADIPYTLTLRSFTDSALLLNFLTAPIPLILPPISTVPFSNYINYVTTNQTPMAAKVAGVVAANQTFTINSIQFEVIPDRLLIYIKEAVGSETVRSSDSFAEIKSVSLTFGNKSGLLSGASQEHLYEMSRRNGCHLDYRNWVGKANKYTSSHPYKAEYCTTGSLLVVDCSLDLGLSSPYLANGSIGQFNLQATIVACNNQNRVIQADVCVVAQRSGLISTSAGQSQLTTNMLNSNIVTQTIENDKSPQGSESYVRMVGGSSSGGSTSGGSTSGGSSKKYSKLAALAM
jgi:hypothetical protein